MIGYPDVRDAIMKRSLIAALLVSNALFAQEGARPALLTAGEAPPLPVQNIAGGQVLLEATVDRTGRIIGITTLRTTPSFEELVTETMRGWRFSPAAGERPDGTFGPIDSRVLVAALFRPPTLMDGPAVGELPRDTVVASEQVPFPVAAPLPPFPPTALAGGVVILEVEIGRDGSVARARVVRAGPGGFDAASTDTIRQWKFRPARLRGTPVASVAYVIFGFSQPIIITEPNRRR